MLHPHQVSRHIHHLIPHSLCRTISIDSRSFLQKEHLNLGFGHQYLDACQCGQLEAALGGGCHPAFRVIRQHHAEMVKVPPGTIHQVRNLATCFKLAVETAEAQYLPLYFQALQLYNNQFFGKLNAQEYLKLPYVISCTVKQIITAWDAEAKAEASSSKA